MTLTNSTPSTLAKYPRVAELAAPPESDAELGAALLNAMNEVLATMSSRPNSLVAVDEFWTLAGPSPSIGSWPPPLSPQEAERRGTKQVTVSGDDTVMGQWLELLSTTPAKFEWLPVRSGSAAPQASVLDQSCSAALLAIKGPWTCRELAHYLEERFPPLDFSVVLVPER